MVLYFSALPSPGISKTVSGYIAACLFKEYIAALYVSQSLRQLVMPL